MNLSGTRLSAGLLAAAVLLLTATDGRAQCANGGSAAGGGMGVRGGGGTIASGGNFAGGGNSAAGAGGLLSLQAQMVQQMMFQQQMQANMMRQQMLQQQAAQQQAATRQRSSEPAGDEEFPPGLTRKEKGELIRQRREASVQALKDRRAAQKEGRLASIAAEN